MANILDYLDWRGDVPFSVEPFNEVDGLILAEFGYLPLDGVVPSDFSVRILLRHAYERYQNQLLVDEERPVIFEQDLVLFEKMAKSKRFRNTQITGYRSTKSTQAELQFSAVTFVLDDGKGFVAYRGTDGSVIGWKEDFNLSYMQQTGAQLYALNYLNENQGRFPQYLRVGGHSKGGNLAVYASAFCLPVIRSRIIQVFTYDGPGFREEIVETEQYKSILPRISSYIPESSVIGLLLNNDIAHVIVKSAVSGLMQHFAYNWEVQRNKFVQAEELSRSGAVINQALSGWLDEMNDDERKHLVQAIFDVISASDQETFQEINKHKRTSYTGMLKAVRKLAPEQQKLVLDSIVKVAKNSKDAILADGSKSRKEMSEIKKAKEREEQADNV